MKKIYEFKYDIDEWVWVLVGNAVYEVRVYGHYLKAENSHMDKLHYKVHANNISPTEKNVKDVFGSKAELLASL